MTVRTARLSEPPDPARDGTRVLITRYRPRGVAKGAETWDAWDRRLAPPVELLDAFFGRKREGRKVVARDLDPIAWAEFRERYRAVMAEAEGRAALDELAKRSAAGETITVLCHCEDETRCHRGLVRELLEESGRGK